MQLNKCPDCDNAISRKATVCPHCGLPIEPTILSGGTVKYNFIIRVDQLMKWLSFHLHNLGVTKFLEFLAKTTIVVGIAIYFLEADDREKQVIIQAWESIHLAENTVKSGGRNAALELLTSKNQNLDGIVLTLDKEVKKVQAKKQQHIACIINKCDKNNERYIDLIDINISNGIFSDAFMKGVRLSKSHLNGVDFSGADLRCAHLWKSKSIKTDFSSSLLQCSRFSEAELVGADFQDAKLMGARFHKAIVTNANFSGADISGADFTAAIGLTIEQIKSADNWQKAIYDSAISK